MPKPINYHAQEKARSFAEKHPVGTTLTVDEFDLFIIDNKMAKDPKTDNVKSNKHKGFVQERGAARSTLNRAAATLNGSAYQVTVVKPGEEYAVEPWTESARSIVHDMGNRVRTFTDGRFSTIKTLQNNVESMMLETGGTDPDLADLHEMVSMMRIQGVTLKSKIAALVMQYNTAADSVEEQMRSKMNERLTHQE